MKEININISGRIPNYMFGIVLPEYYDECEKALPYASDDIQTIEDMLKLLYATVLVGADDGIEQFKTNMDMDEFKANCPLLFEFFKEAEEGSIGYLQFYETVFDMPWRDEVNLIEDDAFITITVDDKEVVAKQKLADFLGETQWVDEEQDPKTAAIVKAFWAKHQADYNLHEDTEFNAHKSKNGVLQLHEWIEPKGLSAYKVRERNVTFEHDNIVDFDFYVEAEEFDLSKLAFLGFSNVPDFHNSAPEYVGSFLAYDNELIRPDQNIHGDKGFTLEYEPSWKSCSFLIEG